MGTNAQTTTQSGGGGCGCLTFLLLILAFLWFTDTGFKERITDWWHKRFPKPTQQLVWKESVTFDAGKPTYLLFTISGEQCEVDAATYDRDSVATHSVVYETCDWRSK